MRITDFPASNNRQIFTAKTEKGYVGCVKKDTFFCVTLEVFDSALKAANKARNLERQLRDRNNTEVKELIEVKRSTSKKPKKKVAYAENLYTLAEAEAMPLLRFQEVWVITKGDTYVSDCLDKENKNLVRYTTVRERAKYFKDHEEAKMTMRVLKNVIGPGFDLRRFFIENN